MNVFATVISKVLEPIVLFLVVFCLLLFRIHLSIPSVILTLCVITFVMLTPSIILVVRALKKKTLTNWDMSVREERIRLVPFIFLFLAIGTFLLWLFGIWEVMHFCMFMLLAFAGFVVITFWFKISGHMIVATACMICLSVWYPGYRVVFLGTLPLLAWSRVFLKRHTISQVVTGFLYGGIVGCVGILLHLV